MAMIKVYLTDETKEALLKEAEAQNMKTSKLVANLIAKELRDKAEKSENTPEETRTVKQKVCKIRLNGDIAEYVQEKSKEQCVTPAQFVSNILYTYDRPVINIPFINDFRDSIQMIENKVRMICYYVDRDPYHVVASEDIEGLKDCLNDLSGVLKTMFRESLKTRMLILKKIDMAGDIYEKNKDVRR